MLDVDIDEFEKKIEVYLNYLLNSLYSCKNCGKKCLVYDYNKLRCWWYLDSCDYLIYLIVSLFRMDCKKCGIYIICFFWLCLNSCYILMFEYWIIDVLKLI